jgi:hypothetical protein
VWEESRRQKRTLERSRETKEYSVYYTLSQGSTTHILGRWPWLWVIVFFFR